LFLSVLSYLDAISHIKDLEEARVQAELNCEARTSAVTEAEITLETRFAIDRFCSAWWVMERAAAGPEGEKQ